MKANQWRQLEEASADMAKSAGKIFRELRKAGFRRKEALDLIKLWTGLMFAQIKLNNPEL